MRLNKLTIDGFRGIRHLDVELPQLVTLIAGKNNSGKSTLLEAVELLACASDAISVARINARREFKCETLDELGSFFYGRDNSRTVSVIGRFETKVERTVRLFAETPQKGDLSAALERKTLPKEYKIAYWEQESEKDPEPGLVRFFEPVPDKFHWEIVNDVPLKNWKIAFCSAGNEPKTCDVVSELKSVCGEDWLVDYLKSLDANIDDITTDRNQILFKTRSPKAAMPLQLMGDGVNKIVKILGLMCSVGEGGVVCIDEVDNGLHYTAMRRFVELIVRVANEKHVQVLMTTHDLEFMRSISSFLGGENESFGYLRMIHCADGETKAFPYDSQAFVASVKGGVELR